MARPACHAFRARRQPISTQGVKCASKRGIKKADEADEGGVGAKFGGPQAEAVLGEVGLGTVDELVAFFGGEQRGHELHDGRVTVHAGEWLAVGLAPAAQGESLCFEDGHWGMMMAAGSGCRLAMDSAAWVFRFWVQLIVLTLRG